MRNKNMFAPKDVEKPIVPVRLNLDSPICFSCDKDLACFTKCCHNNNTYLTPYDVIRIKKRLDMPSDELLLRYTVPGKIEASDLPVPMVKLDETRNNACPFLGEEGCSIYEDRPVACRYYPVAAGLFHNADISDNERFFALVKEGYCLGHDLGMEMTIEEWREKQGIPPYDEYNKDWVELILRRKSLGPFVTIPEKTLDMFFMASYNLDAFRRFVLFSPFLNVYEISEERLEQVKEDDIALLKLGYDWLLTTLFGAGKLKIIEQTVAADSIEVD